MIYDAIINAVGEPYSVGQRAAYGLFDNGYFMTVEGSSTYGLRHCDNPAAIISLNYSEAGASGAGSRTGFAHGQVYEIKNTGGTSNNFYKLTTNGSTITTTLVKANCCTTLGNVPWGGMWISPSGNVAATKSYYSSDTNVNSIYWGESFGINTATGDQLWHFIWKDLGHTNARLTGIVSDNRILVQCGAHGGLYNGTHLIDTTTGNVVANWAGNIPGSQNPYAYLDVAGGYTATVDENLILSVHDAGIDTNPKIIIVAAISTAGDQFTINWLKYINTDWLRSYYGNDGYPIAFNWMGDRRAVITSGGYSYSGGHFEQSVYIVDILTGDISVGESTPWITDGVSFYSGGQFLSGMCGPDDLYISIISDYDNDAYHHTYKILDGGTSDKTNLYYRRLLTDNDTLAWSDDERQIATNWPRGWNLLTRAGEFNGKIAVTPEQPLAHEDASSLVYWIDPYINGYAASDAQTNAWITAKGTGLRAVMAGDSATVVHMEQLDNEDNIWEKVYGAGTINLWQAVARTPLNPPAAADWHLRWSSKNA